MRCLVLLFALALNLKSAEAQKIKIQDPVHFLALGDSYTIGQSVSIYDSWPNLLSAELTKLGLTVAEVKIIAQTGWRTDNLRNAIEQQQPLSGYNLVSLLIGVNNQYQGGSTTTYYTEFESLLKTALLLSSDRPEHVFVLSIPDYAYTPYGGGSSVISNKIDEYNSINKLITTSYGIKYIDITPISRMGLVRPELVANDGLHPSGIMYGLWVQEILKSIEKEVGIFEESATNTRISYCINQKQLTVNSVKNGGLIFVYNSNGKIVYNELLSANAHSTVNLTRLSAGLYILVIENDGKVLLKTKFVLL